jgi:hypothetical protein
MPVRSPCDAAHPTNGASTAWRSTIGASNRFSKSSRFWTNCGRLADPVQARHTDSWSDFATSDQDTDLCPSVRQCYRRDPTAGSSHGSNPSWPTDPSSRREPSQPSGACGASRTAGASQSTPSNTSRNTIGDPRPTTPIAPTPRSLRRTRIGSERVEVGAGFMSVAFDLKRSGPPKTPLAALAQPNH